MKPTRAASLSIVAAALLLTGACGEEGMTRVTDPAGDLSFSLVEPASAVTQPGRSAWHMQSGVTVTTQRIPVSDTLVRGRTVEQVADSLGERFAAGEVEGALSRRRCTVAGRDTLCLEGHMDVLPARGGAAQPRRGPRATVHERGDGRYLRRGALLALGSEIVLVEVIGPDSQSAMVATQAEVLARTLEVL